MAFFAKDVPSLCYGLRGIAYMQLDLQRPNRDLHSGSYGGSVHNPIQALSEIIAQLHDRDGRVTIGGSVTPRTVQVTSLCPSDVRRAFPKFHRRESGPKRGELLYGCDPP